MGRRQTAIIFPHLNDGGGDLSKIWYVEWKYRIPGIPEMKKEREYKALNLPTAEARYKAAEKVIKEKRKWLESGEYLIPFSKKKVYEDELLYQGEKRLYGKMKESVVCMRTYMSEFIRYKSTSVNKRTKGTYISKLRIFDEWLQKNNLHEAAVENITREHIVNFIKFVSERDNLSRATCLKYIQILHSFFDYLQFDKKEINENPCTRIPRIGKIVDCAPIPFQKDDRERLKEAIEKKNPQLWLACEIQYYCAVRPGTELRLMKVGWIDFEKGEIRIPATEAKNDKTQIIQMPKQLITCLNANHIQQYDKELYLFGKNGCPGDMPLGVNTMRNRFNLYREALGLPENYKFYSWKHSGAVTASENGMNPYELKEHLRHSNIETTERYIKNKKGAYIENIDDFFFE